MAKLTQAQIKEKSQEWAELQEQISDLESKKSNALAPLERQFAEAAFPVAQKYDSRIAKLQEKAASLEKEIVGWLKTLNKAITLETEDAIAANESQSGNRKIDPQKFLKKAKDKGAEAWACVNILVKQAEKLLGAKVVDEISSKESKIVSSLKLK
jgi:hypothetical protein